MVKEDRSQSLRNEIEELREEVAADRQKNRSTGRNLGGPDQRPRKASSQKTSIHTVAKTAGEDVERAASRFLALCGSWLDALENYVARRGIALK
jgi:hypothetical protein